MILRPSKLGVLSVIGAAAVFACSAENGAVAPASRPGGPAYWESNVPAEPNRSEPTPRPEWSAGADAGATPRGMRPEGTTDKFLWQEPGDKPPSSTTPPEAQTPLRTRGEGEKVDGGSDAGE